jgi:hypothetical protein
MANTDVSELKVVLEKILKAVSRDRRSEKKGEGKYYKEQDYQDQKKTTSGIVAEYEKLRREIKYQKDIVSESRLSYKKLRDEITLMIKPTSNLEKAFRVVEHNLLEQNKKASDEYKKVSMQTFQAFKGIIKSGKNFDDNLGNMAKSQMKFLSSLENAYGSAKSFESKLKELADKKEATKSDIASLAGKMKGKTGKDRDLLSGELQKKQKELKGIQGKMDEEYKSRSEFAKKLSDKNGDLLHGISELEKLQEDGLDVLHGVNLKNIKEGKITGGNVGDLGKVIKQFKKNVGASFSGAEAAGAARAVGARGSAMAVAKYVGESIEDIVKKAAPQIEKDFTARQYYGVNESLGTKDIANNLGMSEQERATLVGKNQSLFRSMGNGDENQPFREKTIHNLQQNMLKNFGLYGKEAAEKIAEFGNTMMNNGFRPTEKNLTLFSDNIRIAATVLGEAPDTIKSFYDSLGQTGQMALLNQAYADKSDDTRLDLIQKNTTFIMQLNKTLGLSVEEMKKQNEMAMSQKYAGLEQAIRDQIGRSMLVSQYNAANPNSQVTDDQFALGDNANLQQSLIANAGNDPAKRKAAEDQIAKAREATQKVNMQEALNTNKNLLSAVGSGNFAEAGTNAASSNLMFQIAGGLRGVNQGQVSEQSLADFQKRKGQGTDGAITSAQDVANSIMNGRMAGKSVDNIKVDDVTKAKDSVTAALDATAKALIEFKTQLSTIFEKNPAGMVAGSVGNLGKEILELTVAQKLMGYGGKAFGALKGRLFGAGAAEAAAAAGTGEAVAGTTAAAAGGTGLAATLGTSVGAVGAGTLAAGVGVAGGVGYGVGTLANKAWDSTKYGQDVNDAVNAVAGNGIEAAVMKIHAMVDPLYSMSMAKMPRDQVAQLEHHKAALGWLNHTVGSEGLQKWDNSYNNMNIKAQIKNGSLTYDELKQAGASDEFLKSLGDQLNGNPDNAKMIDILKDIKDNTKKTTEQHDEKERNEQYRFDTAQAIKGRIDDFNKKAKTSIEAITSRIPSGT